MGEFADTLLRHPFAEDEKMNKYKDEFDEVRDMMLTMKDMKAGQPSVQFLLARNRQYFVQFLALSTITVTTNSVGYSNALKKTYMKQDSDTAGKKATINPDHDGLINSIFSQIVPTRIR